MAPKSVYRKIIYTYMWNKYFFTNKKTTIMYIRLKLSKAEIYHFLCQFV